MPYDYILDEGIIISKNKFIKILKVIPINYDLKSNLEKEAILNSYQMFLKSCQINIQILIQSKKENLEKQISNLEKSNEKNNKIKKLINEYKNYIIEKNNENKSASKNFYIIIFYELKNNNEKIINKKILINLFKKNKKIYLDDSQKKLIINILNDNFFKIKETLSRCGNLVYEISEKEEIEKIIKIW